MKRSIDDYEAPGFDAQQLVPEITEVTTNLGARKSVEVEVRQDGRVLWVNVDGVCVLRCHMPMPVLLAVKDARGLGSDRARGGPPDTD